MKPCPPLSLLTIYMCSTFSPSTLNGNAPPHLHFADESLCRPRCRRSNYSAEMTTFDNFRRPATALRRTRSNCL